MSDSHASILLQSVTVADPNSTHNGQQVDILIEDGSITQIDQSIAIAEHMQVVRGDEIFVGPGWCDIGAHCGEPGDEIHETIDSLSRAARAGGYTHVALFSNAVRPFDNRHIISDIQRRSVACVNIIPIPSVSKDMGGSELAEMLDLSSVAPALFTDGFHRKYDNSFLCKALEYAQQCKGRIVTIPGASHAMKNGQVNESKVSAQMGIPGLPGFEEVSSLASELSLVSYVGSSFFVHLVSHAESVDQVRFRREQGLDVTSSVSGMHLLHTEDDVASFDENFKVLPPLRSEDDRMALIRGLREGHIQVVSSNHQPISSEQKECEFGESPFGAIGLETTFLSLVTSIPDIKSEEVVLWMSINPREMLSLDKATIEVGAEADLTLFSLSGQTQFNLKNNNSLSNNSPYRERTFDGRIIGSVIGNALYLGNE